jgi:hypothetical protein
MRELGSHGMPTDGTAYGAFLSYDMPDNGFQIQMRNGTTTHDALAITRANGRVGINKTAPDARLEVVAGSETGFQVTSTVAGEATAQFKGAGTGSVNVLRCQDSNNVELFRVLQNGRGLSQFTAKAWVNFNGTGTPSIRDSHNIYSIGDLGTGAYSVGITNIMTNTNYSAVSTAGGTAGVPTTKCPLTNQSLATGSFRVETLNAATGATFDTAYVHAQVFGD